MISDTPTQPHRVLLLTAREAARCFVPRVVKVRAREIGWRPVVLRWRKRGKHLANVIVRRAAATTKVFSFFQFHSYFANYQTHRRSPKISRVPTSSTRVFDTRIIRNEPRAGAQAATPSFESTFVYRRTLTGNLRSQTSPKRSDTGMSQLSATNPKSAYPIATQLLARRNHLFSRPGIRSNRPFAKKEDVVPASGTQSRILQYRPLLLVARSRNQNNVLPRTHDSKLLPPQYSRTEELIWRRMSKTTTDITQRVRHHDVFDSPERPSSSSVANQQTPADVARAIEAAAAMQITRLDPALMDRLANDVIRRVEKQIRIERERRGL